MNPMVKCILMLGLFKICVTYDLTIIHTNDVHARFDEFNKYGSDCSADDAVAGKCFGGVARRQTKVNEIRSSHGNVLFLDAGDQFMGTPWFTVYKGLAASFFMNRLGYDVMCLGNHEFDLGVDGLVPFLNNITFDVVSANTDVSNEPKLQGKFTNSVVKDIGGEKIGIIGYITPNTRFISNPGPTVVFHDVVDSVAAEVTQLQGQGVNKIIALGHAGFSTDKLVGGIEGVDVVVGGHTDTFLYTGDPPSNEAPEDAYPVVIEQTGGKRALVVQDFTFGKYLGYLNVRFDSNGDVVDYNGNPILLDASVKQDNATLQLLSTWRQPIDDMQKQKIGFTNVFLAGERGTCRLKECNLGNLITDSMIDFFLQNRDVNDSWAPAAIAVINSGGIRTSVQKGTVTAGHANTVQPFRNIVDLITVTGKNLREQLEHSVEEYDSADPSGAFLQVSGLRVTYNIYKKKGERVVSVDVRCRVCDVPSYSPLNDDEVYSILVSTFLLNGGDGFNFKPIRHDRYNFLDADILVSYIERHSPLWPELQERISFRITSYTSSSVPSSASSSLVIFSGLFSAIKLFYHMM